MDEQRSLQQIHVSQDGTAAPFVIVPRQQVPQVRRLFLKHGVAHRADKRGRGEYAVFDLGWGANVRQVQAVLDIVR